MRRLIMILALVVQTFLATHAQVKARVEIPWKEDVRSYLVIPMGEEGMLLATISDKSSETARKRCRLLPDENIPHGHMKKTSMHRLMAMAIVVAMTICLASCSVHKLIPSKKVKREYRCLYQANPEFVSLKGRI